MVLDLPVHVDFLRLSEKSLITLLVALEFENRDNAPGIKKGGALTISSHEVRVRCRAGSIPDHLTIDLEGAEIGDSFNADDLKLPPGVSLADSAKGEVLASISAPKGISAGGDDGEEDAEAGEGEEAAAEEGGEE